ncbi:TIGR03619 family F420-dependent LLM class oxidoreductase [Spongiactinospora sp. TRM90649]|uniref:TIGR03619 family F420-dependent LLM class oxidoreductase n=1 Tax=Spongiactinospora sp. TRM90649 TaxID=3031114 RepID=UPI0023F62BF4|nr:TIGR03619 family F420-dependent LLM class oxidoreductase [Spongiactinospora sp. TRM90649]MDF5757206.1 TIGR03619 family F420-dependent LLM class oxidoreductase [Spongiactinospora sp. TRM90649]
MRFGVNILNFGAGTDARALSAWARFAEDEGFHFAMISDHVAVTPDVAAQYPAPFYDPFTALAWLAGRTSRIGLGTTVAVLPFRSPLLTARMAQDIDEFSGGRMILGVGVSWAEREYAALGLPFGRRGAITDEYLAVIRRCWTEDETSFAGERVAFASVTAGRAAPPIWVGGASPAAMRRAVRFGDAWHPLNVRLDRLRDTELPTLRRIAAEAGRPVPAFAPRIPLHISPEPLTGPDRLAGQGTLDQIHDDLLALAALGAEHVLFDTYRGPGHPPTPEADRQALRTLAGQALDLPTGTIHPR